VVALAGGVLAVSATRLGALDMTVPPLSFEPSADVEIAPGPAAEDVPASTVPTVENTAAPTVEPTLEFAGQRWQLVWALVPSNPAEAAGLWPGTPWPGNPGRSLIGVNADLSNVAAGDGFAVDGRMWTVFEVRQVAPEDWEQLAEQPVEAAEVAVYELADTPGRARVAALARGGR
jgi:hypothetical protein